MQGSLSAWQLQWDFPSPVQLLPNQAVFGATLSSRQVPQGRQLTATKLPRADPIAGDGASTALQISAQLEQQKNSLDVASQDLDAASSGLASIAPSNVSINGVLCSSVPQNFATAPASAVGSLIFQATPPGSQEATSQDSPCSLNISQAQGFWDQNLAYILPTTCSLQFCCGAQLAATPSGSVDAYGFPASQSAGRVGNATGTDPAVISALQLMPISTCTQTHRYQPFMGQKCSSRSGCSCAHCTSRLSEDASTDRLDRLAAGINGLHYRNIDSSKRSAAGRVATTS